MGAQEPMPQHSKHLAFRSPYCPSLQDALEPVLRLPTFLGSTQSVFYLYTYLVIHEPLQASYVPGAVRSFGNDKMP